jgi:hypothetical protein
MIEKFKVGDRVEMTEEGVKDFPEMSVRTGVVISTRGQFLRVRRHTSECWHADYWRLVPEARKLEGESDGR